eukprot:275605-Pelagomonas_calceolata.AAC.5
MLCLMLGGKPCATLALCKQGTGHGDAVHSVAWNTEGKQLVTACEMMVFVNHRIKLKEAHCFQPERRTAGLCIAKKGFM